MSKSVFKYRLSQALRFRIASEGKLYASISHSSGEFYVAPEVLSILCGIATQSEQAFNVKVLEKNLHHQYKSTLQNLPKTAECEDIITDLVASGLVHEEGAKTSLDLQQDGFGDEWVQWAMLADEPRGQAYEQAIFKSVNAQSIAADVGAGSGLLSALCLKAGAQKVTAIEETHMAKSIEPLLKSLSLPTPSQQLSVLNCNSFDATLPPNTNLVVSELFGNDPFSEGVVSTLKNIALRFKKQPQYIPEKVSVYFEFIDLLEHPSKHRIEAVLHEENGLNKRSEPVFSKEFLLAAKKKFNFKGVSFPLALHKNNFTRMCAPILLGELPLNPPQDYRTKKSHPLFGRKTVSLLNSGQCPVGLMWFKVSLSPGVTLSSHPQESDSAHHWSPLAILVSQKLKAGEAISISHELNELESQIHCTIWQGTQKIGGR